MSVALYFVAAADHAEILLRGPRQVWLRPHPFVSPATALATRALTRAMVRRCSLCEELRFQHEPPQHRTCGDNYDVMRLAPREAEHARQLMEFWWPSEPDDVPRGLRTMAAVAESRNL